MRVGEIAGREPNWLHGLAMVRARDDNRRSLRQWTNLEK